MTPMIFSPISPMQATQPAAPTSKQADNTNAKDLSFKQMLERQAANHSASSPVKKTNDAANNKKTAESEKTSKAQAKAVPTDTEVKTDKKSDIKKADDSVPTPVDATPTATVELLALVANVRPPAQKLDDTVSGKGELHETEESLDPLIGKGKGKRTNPAVDFALLKTEDKQDLRNDATNKPVPDLVQSLQKNGDAKLLTEAATLQKSEFQSATISTNMVASQAIAQEVGEAIKNPVSDKLTPYVGSSAWNQTLGQKITLMVGATQQTATLSLNPPDLGPLQVILNITKDSADATFIAAQPEVRQALEAALPRLREMMQEAGIALGQANVSSNMPNQQDAQNGSGSKMGAQTTADSTHPDDASPLTIDSKRTIPLGLVDAFA
ncbi:MAG: flagellar hook-length control protein FliK [Burkholderiaceae bacterium]